MIQKKMLKLLKWAGIILGSLLLIAVLAGIIIHKPRPKGEEGPAADRMAREMLDAIHKEAWDSTRYLRWSFPPGHHYHWDKEQQIVQVEWEEARVLLHTPSQEGRAWEAGKALSGPAAEEAIGQAWKYFCNDSFWFNAPAKAFDPGTRRYVASLPDGGKGLMVEYQSGGVTPGDAYLWLLEENGLPRAWRMWVSVIPIGGLKASWEGWTELSTGARIATEHDLGAYTIQLENVAGGNQLSDIGLQEDPFVGVGRLE